ncbi:MAG: DUF177 domain-containing protein [Alphaproteobacteria bacterium]|nr:DUF177 domain-containing protein [Alphaproteobacteria bacterium]
MKHPVAAEPELSRPLPVDKIPAGGMEEHIVASPAERKALAARFGLLDLSKLEADLNMDHADGKIIAVTGTLLADVVQQCVVTLEPVPAHITDKIGILFAPPAMLDAGASPPHEDSGGDEAPEPIVNGVIDLGELVAQHLAVALDPYPRKEGASLPVADLGAMPQEAGKNNPFARLAELKKKSQKQGA